MASQNATSNDYQHLDASEIPLAQAGMFDNKYEIGDELIACYDISYSCFENNIDNLRVHIRNYRTFHLSDASMYEIFLTVIRNFINCSVHKAILVVKVINIVAFRLTGIPSFQDLVKMSFRIANQDFDEMDALCKVLRRSLSRNGIRYLYPVQSVTILSCIHHMCKVRWQKKRAKGIVTDTRVYITFSESIDYNEWRRTAEHYGAGSINSYCNTSFPTV